MPSADGRRRPGAAAARLFSRDAIVAPDGFNRWRVPPASIAIHLCIGSVYAWSIFNASLTRLNGVVLSSGDDWTLQAVVRVFMVAIVCLGLSAAFAGRWLDEIGPRVVGTIAAAAWGGGFLIGGLGIHLQQIWLLYLGYGVLGGCGLGLGYVSPVSTLIKWFPDRRGMAAGLAIMGFGGGAIIGAPLKEWLTGIFYRAPDYLGPAGAVELVTEGGRRFAEVSGGLREVVVVTANELARMTVPGPEGVYVVGTGNTGAAETFLVLGIGYFAVMLAAAFSYRVPAEGWRPEGWSPPAAADAGRRMIGTVEVTIERATRSPQFWLLWIVLCFNVTAGIGVLGVAKTMIAEIFGANLSHVVDARFAATYVLMISVSNMAGRFFWASASDYVGRKATYSVFFVLGTMLYLSIPWTAHQAGMSPSLAWLVLFYAVTMLIFTMYGGGFATIPAYLADLFGSKHVGGIHGRLLTAWSVAGVAGPLSITWLRERSLHRAIRDLAETVDPARFEQQFGAPPSQLQELVAQNTVTIAKLMEIVPPGVADPTGSLYDSTMYLMAALLVAALVANLLVRPLRENRNGKP